MAKIEVVQAVEQRLEALWTHTPVFDENVQGSTPADGSAFLQVQFPYSTTERITFGAPGANVYREEGAFRLLVQVERGTGGNQGRTWAAALEAMFLGKHFGGVETFAPQTASSDDSNEDGQFWTLSVAVPYRYDFLG